MTDPLENNDRLRDAAEAIERAIGGPLTYPAMPGLCPICGQWSAFTARAASYRETLVCSNCFSTGRYRRLAIGILRAIESQTGVVSQSIADLPADSPARVRILDTQGEFFAPPIACYELPSRLATVPWIEVLTSSYQPDLPWGTTLGPSKTNQNLEALTFPDGHFDIVLTSDVMEHVRLYERAHAELARVIRPGGYYLFTVPHSRNMVEHLIRVAIHDVDDPSTDEYVLPAEYHGSALPGEGPVLSYRVFGTAIDDELDALGFDVEYSIDPIGTHAVFDTELFTCRRR